MSAQYPLFVKRDLDGFFGLFIDNLVQLLLIVELCGGLCGMSGDDANLIYKHILPGAAISILIGNVFYAWQAHRLARREGRSDITALPYGINTPSLLVYVFFVMAPAYRQTGDAQFAWQMGLLACLGSGLIELAGSFVAERIRKHTPRAALLSTLAGIAITFIAMAFAIQIWQRPLIAMLPLAIILMTYFSRIRLPLGMPGGLVAVAVGTVLAWILPAEWTGRTLSAVAVAEAWDQKALQWPVWSGGHIMSLLHSAPSQWLGSLSVIIPMGLFNVMGSLQNIESAEAGGDRFKTRPSLMINGIGTIFASLFGCCFPTTIYIGHPGWKGLGARAGYSTLSGLVITVIGLTGTLAFLDRLIPIEAGIAIVLWIGIIITAQAFQATPKLHAPAVAIGLFPAIAAWGLTLVAGSMMAAKLQPVSQEQNAPLAPIGAGATMQDLLTLDHPQAGLNTSISGFLLHGMIVLERGYIFTCMILAALAAMLIDRKFTHAAVWALIAAALTSVGLMHAYQVRGDTVDFLFLFMPPDENAFAFRGYALMIGYILIAIAALALGQRSPKAPTQEAVSH